MANPDFTVTEEVPGDKESVGTDPSEKHFPFGQKHTLNFESEVSYDVEIVFHASLRAVPDAVRVPAWGTAIATIHPKRKGTFRSGRNRMYSQCPTCQTVFPQSKVLPALCGTEAGTAFASRAEGEPIIIIDAP
ncbi:MAG: hypothetical protein EHM24_18200 [Acidobacteria bacterium]|nr:MAG: hypothetical protein EHM24_18200 [Acidobacteriota bacterium]